jgi:RNA-directed DNA polymerase
MTALRVVDDALVRWAQQKYKRFRYAKGRAWGWLKRVKSREPHLFAHWVLEAMVG